MYVYLYDNFLKHRKFQSVLKNIETRLTDFGIAGKIVRLQRFTNPKFLIDDEIRRGVTTVVIVGNDDTLARVLSRAATCETTFGFIPVGPENTMAEVLGIPIGDPACVVLSKRRKIKLDIGWLNNRYFISRLYVPPSNIRVTYDDLFTVSAGPPGMELVVCNLQPFTWKKGGEAIGTVHPQDGKLEAFIRPLVKKGLFGKHTYEDPSIFPFQEMLVTSKKPFPLHIDGRVSKETKVKIRLARKKVEMIVGKDRKF